MLEQIELLKISMANIQHCLLSYFGREGNGYFFPNTVNGFEQPFEYKTGIAAMTFDLSLEDENIVPLSAEKIEVEYRQWYISQYGGDS